MPIKLSEAAFSRTGTKVEKWLINNLPAKVVYPGKDTLPYRAGIRNIIVTRDFIDINEKPSAYVSVELAKVNKKTDVETALGIENAKTMFKEIIEGFQNSIGKKG